MGGGHHEAVTVVIVLIMGCRVGVGCSIIGAIDHISNVITATCFEAIVRVISRVQAIKKKVYAGGETYSRMKGMANSRVISGSSRSGMRRRHWATSAG